MLLAASTQSIGCERQPDVIFITIDTLRADHVSAFNPDSPVQTPAIDALAAEGISWVNAYSPISVTGPAFCTMHTGKEPGSHGVTMNVFRGGAALDTEEVTLAETLRGAGYARGAFLSGFTLQRKLNLNQGFPTYDSPGAGGRRRSGDLTANRMWWWLSIQLKPVFAWYHSYDVHGPLSVWEEPKVTRQTRRGGTELERIPEYQRIEDISDAAFFAGRYATAVAFADQQVANVVNQLRNTGRYNNSIIVFTADHGESFTERELWFDHGTHASEEQLHVPLIIRFPDQRGAGTVSDALVGLADIAPTVLDYLGIPSDVDFDGHSLLADNHGHTELTGESSHCKSEAALSCEPKGYGGKILATRTAARAVHRHLDEDGEHYEIYDRTTDHAELHPLADTTPSPTEQRTIDRLVEDRLRLTPAEPPASTGRSTKADTDELEALRALGYISP